MPISAIWTWAGGIAATLIGGLIYLTIKQSGTIGELKALNKRSDKDMDELYREIAALKQPKSKESDHVAGKSGKSVNPGTDKINNELNDQIDHLLAKVTELQQPGKTLEQLGKDIDYWDKH